MGGQNAPARATNEKMEGFTMSQKVLIVEDDSNIAELLHLYLEKEGFETKVAKDGGKGVEYFPPSRTWFAEHWALPLWMAGPC